MALASRVSGGRLGPNMADDKPALPVVTDSLALALVASSDAPILLLDGALTVIAASASFARAFHIEPSSAAGASLFALGEGEWDVPQLRSLLRATLSGAADVQAYEMDLRRPGSEARRLVLSAHQLDHGDAASVRLLLAVSDVTDARLAERLKDDLLREKAILFQELQHRVANSLQIIASVLMQTARRAPLTETKSYLYDAHNRVMSVATLQRQLAASSLGDVELRAYFSDLCESIGASMIPDREKLKLSVKSDPGSASADVSVSLGLIVTELVINALKHAFPDGRGGQILVGYETQGGDWTLSVKDDGVGMPTGGVPAKAGLGTSIVQALAKQLGAEVTVADTRPGTNISVAHKAPTVDGHEAKPALAV
jgi:two-component sensor histidine kinase